MTTSLRLIAFFFGILGAFTQSSIAQIPSAVPASGARGRGPAGPGLTLTSPAFEDGGILPARFTALDPKPVSPRLEWTNVPANAAAFVLIMHDPDMARQGKIEDVLHWLIINVPGTARELPEGVPNTAQLADGSIQMKPAPNRNASLGKFVGDGER